MVYVVNQKTDVLFISHGEKICLVQSPTGSASLIQVMNILVSRGCKKVIAVDSKSLSVQLLVRST